MFTGREIKPLTSLVQCSGQWACGNVMLFIKRDLFNPRSCEMRAFAFPSFPRDYKLLGAQQGWSRRGKGPAWGHPDLDSIHFLTTLTLGNLPEPGIG